MDYGNGRLATPKSEMTRYKPYVSFRRPQILKRDSVTPCNLSLLPEDDLVVEQEEDDNDLLEQEEGNPSDVMMRPVRKFEEAAPSIRHLSSLRDCIRNGVLDMECAARFLNSLKTQRRFNEEGYEDFVRHAATSAVRKFCYKRFKEISDFKEYRDLNTEATQLMADISMARAEIFDRRMLYSSEPSTRIASSSAFSLSNCTKPWILNADKPFVKVDLVAASMSWTPKPRESNAVQALSLFRFLFRKVTDPPEKIKEYAIRLNGRNGRDDKLKNLPVVVERTLLDFAEDMLGYGKDELQFGAVFDRTKSRFFLSLGRTDEERKDALENLIIERSVWRKQLMKALQRALSDVRSFRCESTQMADR